MPTYRTYSIHTTQRVTDCDILLFMRATPQSDHKWLGFEAGRRALGDKFNKFKMMRRADDVSTSTEVTMSVDRRNGRTCLCYSQVRGSTAKFAT
eukprot:1190010-Prorocentrum_minimum.AAC.1